MGKYANRNQVLAYLKAQGYKVSKSQLYRDTDAGLLILEPDGSILGEAVERYIVTGQLQKPAEQTVQAAAKLDQKTSEEIRSLRLKNQKLEIEMAVLVGKYVLKTDAEAQQAELAAVLDALPRHILILNLPRYLGTVGADPSKARTLFELFDTDFTQAVNQICADGGVELVPGGDDNAAN